MGNKLIIVVVIVIIGIVGFMLFTSNDTPTPTEVDQTQTTPEPTEPAPQVMETNSIVDIAIASEDLSTLVAAVVEAGFADTLATEGPFTVLAPTNSAFAALPAGTVETLLEPENLEDLQTVLGYHVIPGVALSENLTDGMSVTTLTGDELTVSITADGVVTIGGSTVITADVMADNGVVHIIDSVIVEPS